jgi:hypothetical protein
MSAGIISACLPTLGPVMGLALRKAGLKSSVLSTRDGTTTNLTATKNMNIAKSATGSLRDRTDAAGGKSTKKDGAGTFYRLPDDQHSSGETTAAPTDAELRPDHGYGYSVTSGPGSKLDGSSLSGDEIPLHGIRVHTDFKQSAD